MAIPIPSNLPFNPVVDINHKDLITPPSAPTVVENLAAIDPRVALKVPLPVENSSAGNALQDALQNQVNKNVTNIQLSEPSLEQAVLLELSQYTNSSSDASDADLSQANSLLSQNLSRMDAAGSSALGLLLSDILAVDIPELGQPINMSGDNSNKQNAIVNWPKNSLLGTVLEPRVAMNGLYQSLQNSGLFAANQLKELIFPSGDDREINRRNSEDMQSEVSKLFSQLNNQSNTLQDSIKLLLRGDLLWQGQLLPNVQGRLYREDAWQADPNEIGQMQKGSKITMEVNFPNLGLIRVVGTQFGESIHVSIESPSNAQQLLSNSFALLLEQMRFQVDADVRVSIKKDGNLNG